MLTRTPGLVAISVLVIAASASAQDPSTLETPADVARHLVAQNAVLNVPVKGKVRPSFKKDTPLFPMPGGPSPVALFLLPEYQAPYGLLVKSERRGAGLTTELFVPSLIFYDADFNELASFGAEGAAPNIAPGGRAGMLSDISKVFQFDESNKHMRYVLMFTRADMVQSRVAAAQGPIHSGMAKLMRAKVERSFEGKVQVETKPQKPAKGR